MRTYLVTTSVTFKVLADSPKAARLASMAGGGSYEGIHGNGYRRTMTNTTTEVNLVEDMT